SGGSCGSCPGRRSPCWETTTSRSAATRRRAGPTCGSSSRPRCSATTGGCSILLCHYPRVLDHLEPDRFDLVLAGHMHDGQIALPLPGGKVRFAHLTAPFNAGVYRSAAATMHVSAGLGTTFVPFRFAARPEATELVL